MRTQTSALLAAALSTGFIAGCVPQNQQLTRLGSFYAGREPTFAIPADVNADGKIDLVVTRNWGRGEITVLLGNGDGTFAPGASIAASGAPKNVTVADFNGDGKVDLAIPDFIEGGFVSTLLNKGDGTFNEATHHVIGRAAGSMKATDLNGDGKLDLIAVNVRPDSSAAGEIISSKLTVLMGHGDGTFDAARTVDLDSAPRGLALGDFNGDGKTDVVLADEFRHELLVLNGRGDGNFDRGEHHRMRLDPIAIIAGDFDKDGHLDLAVGVAGGNVILLGSGDGMFRDHGDYYTESTRSSWATDLDKDGNIDLVTAHRVLRGDGHGRFELTELPHKVNDDAFVAAADFNGDGWPDVVATDLSHNQLVLYLNRGGRVALQASR